MKRHTFSRKIATALFVLVGLSAVTIVDVDSASAQDSIDCVNPSSNVEYKACAYRAYMAADKELNRVYKEIIADMSAAEKEKLVDAQLAWIKFRDANCEFEVHRNIGGSGYGGFLSNCLERMTNTRIQELQNWRNI